MLIDSIPEQIADLPLWERHQVALSIIRLDQTHPHISGNKWFKLQPALRDAQCTPGRPLLSFGGPYSNHLHALAYAGYQQGIPTLGVIRGEPVFPLNPTLQDAERWGMRLHFVTREAYSRRSDPEWIECLRAELGDFLMVPEGGSSPAAVQACADIWSYLSPQASLPDYLACALGTGATAAGLITACPATTQVLVVPALKVSAETAGQMLSSHWTTSAYPSVSRYQVFSGDLPYARISPMLAALWYQLSTCYGIDLDPVYTLRVYYRLSQLLLQGGFAPGSRVALLHTGGLQGLRGCRAQIEQRAPAFSGPLPL